MIDRTEWHWFRVGDIFPPQKCKCSNATELLEDGDEIAYVGAKKSENGVMRYVKREEKLVSRGNCIVFIGDGQGSVGYSLYQPVDFIGSTTLIAGYNEHLNPYNAAFLITILDRERFRYSFGRKYKKEVVANTKIQLPAVKCGNDEYEPDWQYMEDFIKDRIIPQLPKKAQKVWLKKYNIEPLNIGRKELNKEAWEWFEVGKVLQCKATKHSVIYDQKDGVIPLVSRSAENNGITALVDADNTTINKGNCITIGAEGLYAFYQPCDFVAGVKVYTLRHRKMSPYNALFICQILNREVYRYSYGNARILEKIKKERIKLPAIKRLEDDKEIVEPDWQFMEDYIKSLPYSKNLEPSDPNEKVDELMEMKKRIIEMERKMETINGASTVNIIGSNVTYLDQSKNYSLEK